MKRPDHGVSGELRHHQRLTRRAPDGCRSPARRKGGQRPAAVRGGSRRVARLAAFVDQFGEPAALLAVVPWTCGCCPRSDCCRRSVGTGWAAKITTRIPSSLATAGE